MEWVIALSGLAFYCMAATATYQGVRNFRLKSWYKHFLQEYHSYPCSHHTLTCERRAFDSAKDRVQTRHTEELVLGCVFWPIYVLGLVMVRTTARILSRMPSAIEREVIASEEMKRTKELAQKHKLSMGDEKYNGRSDYPLL